MKIGKIEKLYVYAESSGEFEDLFKLLNEMPKLLAVAKASKYVLDQPVISDEELESLRKALKDLEKE